MKEGNLSAPTTTSAELQVGAQSHPGGFNTLYASGTFGGGTLTIQASPNGTDWFSIPSGTLSAAGVLNFTVRAGKVRLVVVGGSGWNLDWWVL